MLATVLNLRPQNPPRRTSPKSLPSCPLQHDAAEAKPTPRSVRSFGLVAKATQLHMPSVSGGAHSALSGAFRLDASREVAFAK